MPPLPTVSGTQLIKALERAGFAVTRVKGSHHRLKHPDGRATTIPVHSGRDTLRSVLEDADLTVEELRKLL
jgi:predicted RNA binding protein YcfA (HicA-like mRNA interferase family)